MIIFITKSLQEKHFINYQTKPTKSIVDLFRQVYRVKSNIDL